MVYHEGSDEGSNGDSNEDQFASQKFKVPGLEWDTVAKLLARPNRFLAEVQIESPQNGAEKGMQRVHVRDPGRLEELLYPGNMVLIRKESGKNRSTQWTLISARHLDEWILVNSGLHRRIAEWVLANKDVSPFGAIEGFRAEVVVGKSRLDFRLDKQNGSHAWVEVKGCTLTVDGRALFPDAPTTRGVKHLQELMALRKKGERAGVLMLVFRPDSECFAPNRETDPLFWQAMKDAIKAGVEVYPLVFRLKENGWIEYLRQIPMCQEFTG